MPQETQIVSNSNESSAHRWAFLALLGGNVALATGPFLVRHSEVGPFAAGFWRLAIALPFLLLIAPIVRQPVRVPRAPVLVAIAIAAFFFAADLGAWHMGIRETKLGNATLFGNLSSFLFAAWGLWLVRRWPSLVQSLSLLLAAIGCALLMLSSAELGTAHLRGDLLSALAGLLYTGYLIAVDRTRAEVQPIPLLFFASLFGAAMLLWASLHFGEVLLPADWTALIALALCSQVIGQGLLVYALGHIPPLVVGVAMLTQPALSALLGYVYYDEALTPLDWLGALLIVVALILVRLRAAKTTAN